MRQWIAVLLCSLIVAPGCATTRKFDARMPAGNAQTHRLDPMVMGDYIRRLPLGARVKVTLMDGSELRGTLIKNDADPIVVQPRGRIPEAPVEIAVTRVLAVELEGKSSSVARTVAIGVATGVGAFFGIVMLLAAIYSD